MECSKCKKEIDNNDIYCGFCGINLFKYEKHLKEVKSKIRFTQDIEYRKKIEMSKNNIQKLEKEKAAEIERIRSSRWTKIGNNFAYNMTEGKIRINNTVELFSSILGAGINSQSAFRSVTTGYYTSKKHTSLFGALAGGLVLGPLGAVAGGVGLGKTTSSGRSISNPIPTSCHLGVIVNINGFNIEMIILSSTVDQSSSKYKKAFNIAKKIVEQLHYLSTAPIPSSYLKIDEEQSVLAFDTKINYANEELEKIKQGIPTNDIPKEDL